MNILISEKLTHYHFYFIRHFQISGKPDDLERKEAALSIQAVKTTSLHGAVKRQCHTSVQQCLNGLDPDKIILFLLQTKVRY